MILLISEKVKKISPVFLDFYKDFKQKMIGKFHLYIKNIDNKRFVLSYVYDFGKDHHKKLSFALDYFSASRYKKYSFRRKSSNFIQIRCEINVQCSSNRVEITLSGLSDNFKSSLLFFEKLFTNVVADEDILSDLKLNNLKKRYDDKLDQHVILWKAMINYAKYGSNSSFTNVLTDIELKNTSSEELLTLTINKLIKHSHKIYYYGPENINRVSAILKEHHTHNSNLLLQKNKVFKEKYF